MIKLKKNKTVLITVWIVALIVYIAIMLYSYNIKTGENITTAEVNKQKVVVSSKYNLNKLSEIDFVSVYKYEEYINDKNKVKSHRVFLNELSNIRKEEKFSEKDKNNKLFLINFISFIYIIYNINFSILLLTRGRKSCFKSKPTKIILGIAYFVSIILTLLLSYISIKGYIPYTMFKINFSYVLLVVFMAFTHQFIYFYNYITDKFIT